MTGEKNHIDASLLFAVMILMALSLGVVYSASAAWAQHKFGASEYLLNSHAFKVLLGLIVLFVGMNVRYDVYQKLTKPVLIAAVVLLVLTLLMGGEVKGASRWLRIGSFGFQPSEFAKFALLFHLCTLLSVKGEAVRELSRGFLPLMVWICAVAGLVLLQPNFSTASMIVVLGMFLLYIGRVRVKHLLGTVAVALAVFSVVAVTKPHVTERLNMFLGNSGGARPNYQLWQGIIGFGNGGIFGVGPGESRQRDFFLPESYGDFVFSIVGEEYGLVGTMLFLALFVAIMVRGFRIAKYSRDTFGFFLAIGITSTISLYAVVNAGVAIGVLPTTGLPMPFVSYGGSAIVFTSFAIGVLLNISAFTDLHPRAVKIPVIGTVNASGGLEEIGETRIEGGIY